MMFVLNLNTESTFDNSQHSSYYYLPTLRPVLPMFLYLSPGKLVLARSFGAAGAWVAAADAAAAAAAAA